jgi:oligopeptide transport system substrate-binding protein
MGRGLRTFLVLACVIVGLVLVASLGPRRAERADFTFINRGDVATLDLQKMSWMQDLRVARTLFEGLVSNDIFSRDFRVVPAIAERWTVSEDGLTYTFFLRDNAKWSNGDAVRASDFVFAWRRALLPDTASDYTALFQRIRGAREFFVWREAKLKAFRVGEDDGEALWRETLECFDREVAIKAIDERTFTFTLEKPAPYFLSLCGFAVFYPVHPGLVSRYERVDPRTGRLEQLSGWTKPGVLISNGPFVLREWRFKRDMQLVRNPHYWNAREIDIDSIAIPSIESPNAAVLAYQSNAVDWVSDVTADYRADMIEAKRQFEREHAEQVEEMQRAGLDVTEIARRLPADKRNHIHVFPAFGTYWFNFNCKPKLADGRDNPLHDKRVRKALALAVDKRRITEQVRRTGERVSSTIIPPGTIAGYPSPKGLGHDPEAGRRLLGEAGYPGGKGFITLEILVNADSGHDKIAQSVKKDWEEHLGLSVEIMTREIKVFRNDLKTQNFMVSRAGWFGDYGDPTTFLDLSRKDDGNNDRKFASDAYEALMDEAADESDASKRLAMLAEAERMLVEDELPLVPLFQYVQVYLYDPHRVTGISSHPRQEQNMDQVDILGDGKGRDAPKAMPPEPPGSPLPTTSGPQAESSKAASASAGATP